MFVAESLGTPISELCKNERNCERLSRVYGSMEKLPENCPMLTMYLRTDKSEEAIMIELHAKNIMHSQFTKKVMKATKEFPRGYAFMKVLVPVFEYYRMKSMKWAIFVEK